MDVLQRIAQKLPDGLELTSKPLTPQEIEQRKVDLYNASVGNLNELDGYDCPRCRNKGYIAEVQYYDLYDSYRETLHPCKCHRARNALRRLARSGLKEVVKKYTFDHYQTLEPWQKAVKEKAVQFCEDNRKPDNVNRWFFMGGQSGGGKSHLCTAIAVQLLRDGRDVRYMIWNKEIQNIQSVVNDSEQYAAKMKELQEVEVLYIDDLFKHGKDEFGNQKPPSEAEVRRAFEIINHRYNNPSLITIISCEWTLAELIDIDEATAGRLAEYTKAAGYCINIKKDRTRNWRLRDVEEF